MERYQNFFLSANAVSPGSDGAFIQSFLLTKSHKSELNFPLDSFDLGGLFSLFSIDILAFDQIKWGVYTC